MGAISSWPRLHILQFSGGSFPAPEGRGIALRLPGDPGRARSQSTEGPIPSASLCAPGEVRPFSLALCLARLGPHYCAACRRGARSRAALCFPAGCSGSREINVQAARVGITLSWEPALKGGTAAHSS